MCALVGQLRVYCGWLCRSTLLLLPPLLCIAARALQRAGAAACMLRQVMAWHMLKPLACEPHVQTPVVVARCFALPGVLTMPSQGRLGMLWSH